MSWSYILDDEALDEILSKDLSDDLRSSLEGQVKNRDHQRLCRACGIEYRDGAEWMPGELAAIFALSSYWWTRMLPHCAGIEMKVGEPTMYGLRWHP